MTTTRTDDPPLLEVAALERSSVRRAWRSQPPTTRFVLAVAPALAVYTLFTLYPMGQVVVASFTDSNGFRTIGDFVGFANYARIFSDPTVLQAVGNTMIYAFFKIGVQTVLAFFIAVLLNRRLLLGNIYRAVFFAPMVISPVAVVFAWSFMFDPTSGAINTALRAVGLGALAQDWLGNYNLALYSVIGVDLWSGLGFNIVIFLAGLSTIPSEITEAARVDGASGWRLTRHITLPMIAPTTGLVLVLAINGALRAFDTVYLMTQGGPGESTQLYMTEVFEQGLVNGAFGYASSMAVLVIIVLICVAVIQNNLNRRIESGMN